ncbi:MAG TPA: GPW/gp25 family protein [Anaerolineales bacterium]
MKPQRYRAFRFVHPDAELLGEEQASGAGPGGLELTPRGSIEMVAEDDSVRQAVLLLLSTRPGERVMRPDYGCDIHSLVFAANDDTTAGIAKYHVRTALQKWEPRIDILRLDAQRDPSVLGLLVITLEYQVRTTRALEQLQVAVNLAGENI